jgi:hypothetical protein
MKKFDYRILWGLLLILAGVIFLLDNLGYIDFSGLLFGSVLGVIGLSFLFVLITDRSRWWAVIPGLILTYLAVLIFMDRFLPEYAGALGGPLLLLTIGLSFWIIYILNTSFWWSIIPAGVLSTLAVVSSLDTLQAQGFDQGGIFFLGLGLTFGLLALIPTQAGRMKWPLIPAGILGVIGLIIFSASTSIFHYLWPIALILAGLYFFYVNFRSKT